MSEGARRVPPVVLVAVVVAAAVGGPLPAPAEAYPRPVGYTLVSRGLDGAKPNGNVRDSSRQAISADGRQVVFVSDASNLVRNDGNREVDTFVATVSGANRDRVTVERVSVTSDEREAVGDVVGLGDAGPPQEYGGYAAISGNGRFVAFESKKLLAAGALPGFSAVYVRDRVAGTTTMVSTPRGTGAVPVHSNTPVISYDGRFVAYTAGLALGGNSVEIMQLYLVDRLRGTRTLVSKNARGEPLRSDSARDPHMTPDGRYLVFHTHADNVGDSDGNRSDSFVYDRVTGRLEQVKPSADMVRYPMLSADGRYVYAEGAANKEIPTICGQSLRYTRATGAVVGVGVDSAGACTKHTTWPVISASADGRILAFNPMNGQLAVRDTYLGISRLVYARDASLSADGRYAAMRSRGSLHTTGAQEGGMEQMYLADFGPRVGPRTLSATRSGSGVRVSGAATVSGAALATVGDKAGDATPLTAGRRSGEDLVAQTLRYHHEDQALLVTARLNWLPTVYGEVEEFITNLGHTVKLPASQTGGDLRVLYLTRIGIDGELFLVAARVVPNVGHPLLRFEATLYGGCAESVGGITPDVCVPLGPVRASLGTTGHEMHVLIPMADIGAKPGSRITRMLTQTWTHVGGTPQALLDEVDAARAPASITIPKASVTVTTTSPRTGSKTSRKTATFVSGQYSVTEPGWSAARGSYRISVRVCLGSTCKTQTTTT